MKKRAILVGINDYQYLGKLHYACQDAQSVAEALKKSYGFDDSEIILMTDTQQRLRPTDRFAIEETLSPECVGTDLDLLLFGFWGHGVWSDSARLLCPINQRETELERWGVPLEVIKDRLGALKAKNICLILDCCQSIAAGRETTAPAMTSEQKRIVSALARDIGLKTRVVRSDGIQPTVAILNACSEGQRAYEWAEKRHGIFTAHLLDALNKPVQSSAELFEQIKPGIETTAARQNVSQSPYYYCQGGANIVLPAQTQTPVQTQETIQTPILPPPAPEQTNVVEFHVDEINVSVSPIQEEPKKKKKFGGGRISMPETPQAIRNLRAQIAGIDRAIEQLQNETHPSLQAAKENVEKAKAQYESIRKNRKQAWKGLPSENALALKIWIKNNPHTQNEHEVASLCPENFSLSRFVKMYLWGEKENQALTILKRANDEYSTKRGEEIVRLDSLKEQIRHQGQSAQKAFEENVFLTFLSAAPGFHTPSAPPPLEFIADNISALKVYDFNLSEVQLWERAKLYWTENRPCGIAIRRMRNLVNRIFFGAIALMLLILANMHIKRLYGLLNDEQEICACVTAVSIWFTFLAGLALSNNEFKSWFLKKLGFETDYVSTLPRLVQTPLFVAQLIIIFLVICFTLLSIVSYIV